MHVRSVCVCAHGEARATDVGGSGGWLSSLALPAGLFGSPRVVVTLGALAMLLCGSVPPEVLPAVPEPRKQRCGLTWEPGEERTQAPVSVELPRISKSEV